MLDIKIKAFNDLTREELYDILQLRSEIFVVEQNCVYQDMDHKDHKAYHLLGLKNNKIIAYTRIFKPGDYFEEASIGRVVVKKSERQFKYGYSIMNASITFLTEQFNVLKIKISAQAYLKTFYNNVGFKQIGNPYLEDGIIHIAMIRD